MMIYCMEINWWKAGINAFFDDFVFISWNVLFCIIYDITGDGQYSLCVPGQCTVKIDM